MKRLVITERKLAEVYGACDGAIRALRPALPITLTDDQEQVMEEIIRVGDILNRVSVHAPARYWSDPSVYTMPGSWMTARLLDAATRACDEDADAFEHTVVRQDGVEWSDPAVIAANLADAVGIAAKFGVLS